MLPSVEIGQLNNPYSCGTEGAVAVNGLSAAPAMTELPPPLSFPVTGPRKTRLLERSSTPYNTARTPLTVGTPVSGASIHLIHNGSSTRQQHLYSHCSSYAVGAWRCPRDAPKRKPLPS